MSNERSKALIAKFIAQRDDPANEKINEYGIETDKFLSDLEELRAEVKEWECVNPITGESIVLKKGTLEKLRPKLAAMEEELLRKRGDYGPPVLEQKKAADGITKEQVLEAFGELASINLKKALGNGTGLFGGEGARTQKGTPGGTHAALWNPVILALGLNEKYSVPMPHLKRAFNDYQFLRVWSDEWRDKLDLIGE